MDFFAALRFLTILPSPARRNGESGDVSKSLPYFPLVGLILGLLLAAIYWLLNFILPVAVVFGAVIAMSVVLSGGLHLDGLADTCDGLAGHKAVEDRLRIMRDSRVGAFAVIGVSFVILLKYVSLSAVPASLIIVAIILMPVLSRWAMVFAVTGFHYARAEGLGASYKKGAGWSKFAAAALIAIVITLLITYAAGLEYFYGVSLILVGGIWLVTVVVSYYLKGKFSGLTGDMYGAVSELTEVAVPVIILVLAQTGGLLAS